MSRSAPAALPACDHLGRIVRIQGRQLAALGRAAIGLSSQYPRRLVLVGRARNPSASVAAGDVVPGRLEELVLAGGRRLLALVADPLVMVTYSPRMFGKSSNLPPTVDDVVSPPPPTRPVVFKNACWVRVGFVQADVESQPVDPVVPVSTPARGTNLADAFANAAGHAASSSSVGLRVFSLALRAPWSRSHSRSRNASAKPLSSFPNPISRSLRR